MDDDEITRALFELFSLMNGDHTKFPDHFITNFDDPLDVAFFLTAAETTGYKMYVDDPQLPMKTGYGLYLDEPRRDCTKFWNEVDRLRNEGF